MLDIKAFRSEKDRFFELDPHSPLSVEQRKDFPGLNYFPENPGLAFEVEIQPFSEQNHVKLQTSTGDLNIYLRYGKFSFEVAGIQVELTVFTHGNGDTFLPFVDQTSPEYTYGAGRYLELDDLGDNRYRVDFNLAYNPWCAYSPDYSCPLPPDENRLLVPIEAGEMNYSTHTI
jgi:uncharacterized protein (DUF1684 family)